MAKSLTWKWPTEMLIYSTHLKVLDRICDITWYKFYTVFYYHQLFGTWVEIKPEIIEHFLTHVSTLQWHFLFSYIHIQIKSLYFVMPHNKNTCMPNWFLQHQCFPGHIARTFTGRSYSHVVICKYGLDMAINNKTWCISR